MSRAVPGRIAEIEGIRGILSMTVIAGHLYNQALFWYWGCMDIFFCISGFVITRILLENLDPATGYKAGFLKNYFVRRAIRIWPMYYVAMAFAYVLYYATDGVTLPQFGYERSWDPRWWDIVLPLVYLQNTELYFVDIYHRFHYLVPFGHSWSVAIEEHFYLLWPLALLWVVSKSSAPMQLFWVFAAIAVTATARWKELSQWLLLARLDGFALGILLAYLEAAALAGRKILLNLSWWFRWLWLWPCAALVPNLAKGYFGINWDIPGPLMRTIFDANFNFALLAFCWLGYCLFVARPAPRGNWMSRVLGLAPLQHLGAISYSTYLLHIPVVVIVAPYLISAYDLPAVFNHILGFGLSIALAHLTYTWVEARAMRLKRYFTYKPAKTVPPRGLLLEPEVEPAPPLPPGTQAQVNS